MDWRIWVVVWAARRLSVDLWCLVKMMSRVELRAAGLVIGLAHRTRLATLWLI